MPHMPKWQYMTSKNKRSGMYFVPIPIPDFPTPLKCTYTDFPTPLNSTLLNTYEISASVKIKIITLLWSIFRKYTYRNWPSQQYISYQ